MKEPKSPKSQVVKIVAVIIGIIIILAIGVSLGSSNDSSPITYQPPGQTQDVESSEPKFEAITLTGTGQKVTEPFELRPGGYKVSSEHVGTNPFSVYLVNSKGEDGPLVANEIGDARVSDIVNVKGGKYLFKVQADGKWTIKIEAL